MRLRSLALALIAAGVLLAGPIAAASAASQPTDVDDFDFSSWDATFEVGIDDDGRATLHVQETRVAEFPEFDQNRGIVAGYPLSYRGASTEPSILSVRDESGNDVEYETEEDDGILYVLTGGDEFVHGATTYVIEYEMRDIILAATETKVDEFYWDLLPLDSTQDIAVFRAEIIFDDSLTSHLTGDTACYEGGFGSATQCELQGDGNGVFTIEQNDLAAGSGITVAIALEAGTITQPPARLPNAATDIAPYPLGGGVLLLSLGGWLATKSMIRRRRRGTGIVIAQYDVPDDMPPLLAGAIHPDAKNPIAAEIIHLAVRGSLQIEELPDGSTDKQPRLRRRDAPPRDPLDANALQLLFGSVSSGTVFELPKNDESFAARMQSMIASGPAAAAERGLTTKASSTVARVIQVIAIAVFAALAVLLLWSMFTGRESAGPVFFITLASGILLVITTVSAFRTHTVLTKEGALQLEYLDGVREFIRVAEEDRLRMLQSYSGADRRSDGSVDVIHVYEKLLPYAIVFGQEREWGEVLEHSYRQANQQAAWMGSSNVGFQWYALGAFSSSVHSASTYSAPSTSSSSGFGGSSGGGFSGGGGGGGFSGGR
ncbi:DUF2207 domain-containing protein [Microbacterium sp.]|uniref:DUF2207 domain-containing protein n=1 Tax=Microbacterium sp. TaxID=51671 RepID=UPI003A8DB748